LVLAKCLYVLSVPVCICQESIDHVSSIHGLPTFHQSQETHGFMLYIPHVHMSCTDVHVGRSAGHHQPHHQPHQPQPDGGTGAALVVIVNVQPKPQIVNVAVVGALYHGEEVCCIFIVLAEKIIPIAPVNAPLFILYTHQTIVTWLQVISPEIVVPLD